MISVGVIRKKKLFLELLPLICYMSVALQLPLKITALIIYTFIIYCPYATLGYERPTPHL
jgi:hypothetical protein